MNSSEQHRPDEGSDFCPDQPASVSRRRLIKSAMIGATGLGLATKATSQARSQTPVASPVPVQTPKDITAGAVETWGEPWIFRPSQWPGQHLELNVVENENPGPVVGFGNPSAVLFSYGGITPGPTIRMKGDEILFARVRNMLSKDQGTTTVGPNPDPNELPPGVDLSDVTAKATALGNVRKDFCLGEHINGVHSTHVTNLHTHGLHVRPGRNPDGTHSDNVILRLLNQGDFDARQENADSPYCAWLQLPNQTTFLQDDEEVGHADYQFRLGDVQSKTRQRLDLPPQAHPPGTHWYHPHTHGSTHNQVSSGMAGFLIVEGDVDEAINLALTGDRSPDPQMRTGDYDYMERVMLIQRVFVQSADPDKPTQELKSSQPANPVINGDQTPAIITMRPGAIERWRVLNGSVDGKGFSRFMVLKGQYAVDESNDQGSKSVQLVKLTDSTTQQFGPATRADIAADKQQLYQLAFDGVTLVTGEGENAAYTIKDLAQQNPGTESPLDRELTGNPNQAMLANLEACFANAENIRNCFVRPNEVYMATANRTDVLFQAPRLANQSKAEVYTVFSQGVVVHSDNYQSALQSNYTKNKLASPAEDVVIAYIVVAEDVEQNGDPAPSIPDFDVMSLIDVLPEIPQYHLPIEHNEVRIKDAEGNTPADPDSDIEGRVGNFRTRTITYSGWGAGDFPLVTTAGDDETSANFRAFVERDQAQGGGLELLRYAQIEGSEHYVLMPPNIRTMAITGSTSDEIIDQSISDFASDEITNALDELKDLVDIRASMGRKFAPYDAQRPRMLEDTAEEWALYNYSTALWADTGQDTLGQYGGHYPGQPLLRSDGQSRFADQPEDEKTWVLTSKGVDHPFHIHQNPVWVMRVEIPDENGTLVNILDEPRWQDVVWIPRSGGRAIIRSRFPDFIGLFVNHCHILLHEDNGMMQSIEITPFADQANYEIKAKVITTGDDADEVSDIYPRLDQAGAWRQSMQFIDPNLTTGQIYPGFNLGDPPSS